MRTPSGVCIVLCAVALALTLAHGSALAESAPDFAKLAEEAVAEAKATKEILAEESKLRRISLEAAAGYNQKFYQHQGWVLGYTRWVYYWHFVSTVIVFFLVAGIVIFGLRLSYLQFKKDFLTRAQRQSQPQPATGGGDAQAPAPAAQAQPLLHSLKLGLQGVEISSSVIGLLILVLSLGFFYLYLHEVYPIKPEGVPVEQTSSKPDSAK